LPVTKIKNAGPSPRTTYYRRLAGSTAHRCGQAPAGRLLRHAAHRLEQAPALPV